MVLLQTPSLGQILPRLRSTMNRYSSTSRLVRPFSSRPLHTRCAFSILQCKCPLIVFEVHGGKMLGSIHQDIGF
jgi:hypothetical protein